MGAHSMMRRRAAIGALTVGAATLLLGACGVVRIFPTYRYRLTVEVDTPEGLKAGSSVIEVRTSAMHLGGIGGGAGANARGEAVTVDLGARGLLFALLGSEVNEGWAAGIMPTFAKRPTSPTGNQDDEIAGQLENMLANKGLIVLPRYYPADADVSGPPPDKPQSDYPLLVRFGDIKDPKSVALVDPDDLAKSLGPGVKLRRITVQLTDDEVTMGIEKRLGWLPTHHGGLIETPPGVPIGEMPFGADVTEGDFKLR